jgi:hypothetical protein
MTIIQLGRRFIEAQIITRTHVGERAYIPRIIISQYGHSFQRGHIFYFGVLCYDNQQKPGAISKHGKTIST